jgi:RND family efflux transporter MFP subunit
MSDNHRPSWLYPIGVLAVLGAAGMVLLLFVMQRRGAHAEEETRTADVAAGPRVTVTRATSSSGERTITVQGEARPYASVTLFAKVSGYLREVRVDKGDRVKENQVIAVIESPETDRQYQAARADADNKRAIAKRLDALAKPGVVSTQDAEQARTNAEVAEASLSALDTQRQYEVLRAPFAGTVTARFADPGALVQNASSSQTSALPVVTISQGKRLRVLAYLDQNDAPLVRAGDPATVRTAAGGSRAARVSRIAGELDQRTRTLLTEIDCDNQDGAIFPGSFVEVTMTVHAPVRVELPASALVLRGEKPFVAVVDASAHVHYRPVVLAGDDGKLVQLESGVAAGEAVAISLGDSVAEGARVQPVEEPPAGR